MIQRNPFESFLKGKFGNRGGHLGKMTFHQGKSGRWGFLRFLSLVVIAASACLSAAVPRVCNGTVASFSDVADLQRNLTICDELHVVWQGHIVLGSTIEVPTGAVLNVVGGSSSAIIDGAEEVQLLKIEGTLRLRNLTLTGGRTRFSTSSSISSSTSSDFSSRCGGAVYAVNGSLLLESCTFISNLAEIGGAVCLYHSDDATIESCTFSNNLAHVGGAAVYVELSDNATMKSCAFNNSFADFGGAVTVSNSDNAKIKSCTFSSNSAGDLGGAMYVRSSDNATMESCTFSSNSAANSGGAVLVIRSDNATMESCTYSSNSAGDSGGAVYVSSSDNAKMESCTFSNNSADGSGGAVQADSSDNARMESCVFSNNSAHLSGAVIVLNSDNATMESCTFSNNWAKDKYGGNGGAVFVKRSDNATMESCNFSNNSAEDSGEAVYVYSGENSTVESCTFSSNWAGNTGGAMCVDSDNTNSWSTTVKGGTFSNNSATAKGGTIYWSGNCRLTLRDCTIVDSISTDGGALYSSPGTKPLKATSVVQTSTFARCSALQESGKGGKGGAVFTNTDIAISGSLFERTSADSDGGALYVNAGAELNLAGSSFITCTAAGDGGAVYNGGTLLVSSVFFDENSAAIDGGALYSEGSLTSFEFCNFSSNSATSGGAAYLGGDVGDVSSSRFDSNAADIDGGTLYVVGNFTSMAHCGFYANVASKGSGGAVHSSLATPVDITFESCKFDGNNAGGDGGAILGPLESYVSSASSATTTITFTSTSISIYSDTSRSSVTVRQNSHTHAHPKTNRFVRERTVVLTKCTFANNAAPSGDGGAVSSQQVAAFSSTFTSNAASTGGAISASDLKVSSCSFSENSATSNGGAVATDTLTGEGSYYFNNSATGGAGGAVFFSQIGALSWPSGATFEGNSGGCCFNPSSQDTHSCADVEEQQDSSGACCGTGTWFGEDGQCIPCPNGFDCSQVGSLPRVQPGFWIAEAFKSTTAPMTRQCWFKKACDGGDPQTFDQSCAGGYLEGSPYCAVCDSGYSRGLGYECVKCSNASKAGLITALALGAVVVAGTVWYVVSDLLDVGDAQDAAGSAQHPAAVAAAKVKAAVMRVPFSKFRAPIVVFQIVSQFVAITGVRFPQVYERFLAFTSIFTFDLGWVLSIGCVVDLTFYQRLLLVTITPLAVLGLFGCSFAFMRHRVRPRAAVGPRPTTGMTAAEILGRVISKHTLLALVFTFLIYSTTSTVVFQTFACDSIPEVNQNWLRADYSVSCKITRTRIAYLIYASVMAVMYPLGIPAVYAWLLWRQRDALTKRQFGRKRAIKTTRFLRRPYKPSRYWWEVAECVRRLCLTGILVFIFPGTDGQVAVACVLSVLSMVAVAAFAPHDDSNDFYTYLLGCVIVFLTTFLALIIKVDVASENAQSQVVLAALLIALDVLLVCAAVVQCVLVARSAVGSVRQSSAYGLRTTSTSGREQMAPES